MSDASNANKDRRVEERFATYVAVEIEGQGKTSRFGVTRDASGGGLLVATPSRFDVGTELTLRLHDTAGKEAAAVKATVVRVDETDVRSDEPWRYRLAVRFEDPESAAVFLAERVGTIPPPA
jgi:hypothetical protein